MIHTGYSTRELVLMSAIAKLADGREIDIVISKENIEDNLASLVQVLAQFDAMNYLVKVRATPVNWRDGSVDGQVVTAAQRIESTLRKVTLRRIAHE